MIDWGKKITSEQRTLQALNFAKDGKRKEVDETREVLKGLPVQYIINGKEYNFQRDILSQLSIVTATQTLGIEESIEWITVENSIATVEKDDLIQICKIIRDRDTALHLAARAIKDEIISLDTVQDVENFLIQF